MIKMMKKKMPIKDENVDVDEGVGGNLNKYIPIRQTKIRKVKRISLKVKATL